MQPEADVEAQKATLNSAEADSTASEAAVKAADENIRTLQAMIDKDESDLDRAKAEYERGQELFNENLIAKQEFDMRRSTYEAQLSTVKQSEMRLIQARAQREQTLAQLAGSQKRIAQNRRALCGSTMCCRNIMPLRRWTAWSPICRCASAKRWCRVSRTPPPARS